MILRRIFESGNSQERLFSFCQFPFHNRGLILKLQIKNRYCSKGEEYIMRKTSLISFTAVSVAVLMALSGCGGNASATTAAAKAAAGAAATTAKAAVAKNTTAAAKNSAAASGSGAPVELLWYTRFDDQSDTAKVNEALNKLTMEKINCTVKMVNIPAGSYNDKMQVILGGREKCDIVFAGAGFADFWGNANRGAFLPLDDLLHQYAQKTYDAIPAKYWDGVKLNGKIYGVINYQIEAKEGGFSVPTETLKKYNFDLTTVKKMEDIEPLLEKIHKDDPGIIPIAVNEDNLIPMMQYDEIGAHGTPGVIVIGDNSLKVVNQYDTDGFKNFVKVMNKWFKAGYIAPDAATLTSYNDLEKAGKVAMVLDDVKPGIAEERKVLFGKDMSVQKIMDGRVLPAAVSATMNCISSTSQHPAEAMKFINLLNTDKDVYNLVCFGIEGTHYKKTGENRIELTPNSGYQPNKAWAMGNQFNAYLYGKQGDTVWKDTIALNESASVSPLLGFVFDPTPVKSQVAQCQSVYDQYYKAIVRGTVDPDSYIPEFLSKLKAAGADEIIAEKQKQLDAWKANKK
jgi:putative aldouronate transport system substrate-binding protein